MKKITYYIIALAFVASVASSVVKEQSEWTSETPVSQVLFALGQEKPDHYVEELTQEKINRGKELITAGRTVLPDGSNTGYISKYYECTSCHNTEREDPNLTVVNQDKRLKYAIKNKLPYLQASTFWGIVDRESWYNGDYIKKYGALVEKASKSLEESVQLCATVCAQGRALTDEEMESVLAYFWSLEMQLGDLELSENEWASINGDQLSNGEKIDLIKSKYLLYSPATFGELPDSKKAGYPYEGNAELGEAIFELGCQHCHRPNGESDVIFGKDQLTLKWLEKHIPDNSQLSIYEIIRKGTYSEYGHREYMPHYTLEKMSDQQVEHLRAFIEEGGA